MAIIFNDYSGVLRCIKFATLKKLKTQIYGFQQNLFSCTFFPG
jgi:hypothetical protein